LDQLSKGKVWLHLFKGVKGVKGKVWLHLFKGVKGVRV